LLYGARNSARVVDNLRRIGAILAEVPVLAFDEDCAQVYSGIRVELKQKGRPCSGNDMMIAATAVLHGATLVTRNTRHFDTISSLSLDDWLSEST